LAFVSYDLGQRVLDLEFRRGAVYRYFDVPPSIHDAFLAADSKGRFFNRHIRKASSINKGSNLIWMELYLCPDGEGRDLSPPKILKRVVTP
jgi:hypothetical protein